MKYSLPDGGGTNSHVVYVKAWRKLGRAIQQVTGCRLAAFDPDVDLRHPDNHAIAHVPLWLAKMIAACASGPAPRVDPALHAAMDTAQNVVDNFHVSDAHWPEVSPQILLQLLTEIKRLQAASRPTIKTKRRKPRASKHS